ncbi:MAG: hypothetical protein LAT52_03310 [Balneolales bacterium]|nr:hypothetical protein [Balneolales bacterium]
MIRFILRKIFWAGLHRYLSDHGYIKIRYFITFGFFPNLANPSRLSEIIQFIKLYDRNPLRTIFADREQVRSYVKDKIGDEVLIPIVGVFDSIEQISWDNLPDSFVAKANHGSGMNLIVQNKSTLSSENTLALFSNWLQTNYGKIGREWAYVNVPSKVFVEELLVDEEGDIPNDYKFWVINQKVQFIQVDYSRFGSHSRTLYDRDFNILNVTLHHPSENIPIVSTPALARCIQLAEILAEEVDLVRVDFYIIAGKIYFGELTNYPGNGFEVFKPDAWDSEFGSRYNAKTKAK